MTKTCLSCNRPNRSENALLCEECRGVKANAARDKELADEQFVRDVRRAIRPEGKDLDDLIEKIRRA